MSVDPDMGTFDCQCLGHRWCAKLIIIKICNWTWFSIPASFRIVAFCDLVISKLSLISSATLNLNTQTAHFSRRMCICSPGRFLSSICLWCAPPNPVNILHHIWCKIQKHSHYDKDSGLSIGFVHESFGSANKKELTIMESS